MRKVDPYTLETMATSGQVLPGTIPAPAAFLTSTTRDYQQLNGNLYIRNTHLANFNTYEQAHVNNSYATRSAWEFNDVVAFPIDSDYSVSAGVESDAQFAIWKDFPNFEDLRVSILSRSKKLLTIHTKEVGTLVRFSAGNPSGRYLPAILNSGNIQVYLPQVQKISGSLKQVRHQSVFYKARQRMRFSLSWWVSAPAPIEVFLSQVGTTNNASFCGFAAGTVMYLRMVGDANVGLSGNIPQYKTAEFELDQAGFYDYSGYQDEWFRTTATVAQGWNNTSAFSDGSILTVVPSQSDFSSFGP